MSYGFLNLALKFTISDKSSIYFSPSYKAAEKVVTHTLDLCPNKFQSQQWDAHSTQEFPC